MARERTFFIIKPDAVRAGTQWKILQRIQDEGFDLLALKKLQLSTAMAEGFYAVHKDKGFFPELVQFMTSGPVFVGVLEKDDAIVGWRQLMGKTNPAEAAEGSLRKLYGANIQNNATHGSDSPENARIEIRHFFNCIELP